MQVSISQHENPVALCGPSYSAADIIGSTLIAKIPVAVKRMASDSAPTVYTVPAGQSIGVVFSWLAPTTGRSQLYWMFNDAYGRPYYVSHAGGKFSLTALEEQGIKTTEQRTKEAAEAAERAQKGDFIYYFEKYGRTAIISAGSIYLAGLVVKTAGEYFKNKSSKKEQTV